MCLHWVLSLETSQINNNRQICKNRGKCTGHYGFARCIFVLTGKIVTVCIFRFFNYTSVWTVKQGVLSQCSVSFIVSSNVTWKCVPASFKFLLLMVSIFFICWIKRFVLLYFSSIIVAKSMQARPFPREDEWTAEWHKPAKYIVYILLVGENVNTLWCKLSHLMVVERGLIVESSDSEKCFSMIPFNFTTPLIFSSKCFPHGRCLVEYVYKCALHTSEYLRQFLWSFSKLDMIFWTALPVCREMNLLLL